jgi:endonuclease/exonuclease/phosphatase family metal-dependent hydrolase
MDDILRGNFAAPRWNLWPPDAVRVITWNIDRGSRLNRIIDFLASQSGDILLLQEVDLNARRTNRRNIAEEIAQKLEMNYVFGYEFQELGQGSRTDPAYHGQATFARWHIGNSRVLRFRRQSSFWRPRWFLPSTGPFQERLGGRIALIAEIGVPGGTVASYNLHLESRGDNDLRIAQLNEALDDAGEYSMDTRKLLAGDLNLDVSRAIPASSLQGLGFRSAVTLPSPHTTTPRGLFGKRRTIDWAYVSGSVEISGARVHTGVKGSDHYPISFVLGFHR